MISVEGGDADQGPSGDPGPGPSSSKDPIQDPSEDVAGGGKKRSVRPIHVYQLSADKEERLRHLYKSLDVDHDGKVNMDDLALALKRQPHVPSGYYTRIFREADTDQSNTIDFSEFVHYVMEHEKKLELVFKQVDLNKDGFLDASEIQSYFSKLGIPITQTDARRLVDRMARKGSATIDLDDFQRYLLFSPAAHAADIAKFWRHGLIIDIGEDGSVPEDFSSDEIAGGVWWRHLLAGGAAGAMSRTCTAPLDRLKVFLQVHSSKEKNFRVISALQLLLNEGGIKGLWRGNGVNVIKIAPESAIKFMAYEQLKRLCLSRDPSTPIVWYERLLAGGMAGAISQTCIYPLEVLKTRLALRRSGDLDMGLARWCYNQYRNEGIGSFYRGFIPNLVGIFPYAGIDLAIYETLKDVYCHKFNEREPGVFALLGCGTCSTVCGQLACYPFALVRTRLQALTLVSRDQPKTMVGQFKYILHSEGFTGLYRGITPNFIKVIPSVGISYVVYENVRKRLGVTMT